jgi:hypothetical protein
MALLDALRYTLTLPERTLRSLSAAVGGVSKLLTDTILPQSLRGTAFYQALLGNTQRFLVESLGEVKARSGEDLPDDFLARKVAGNVADAAGIFAFRFSPLWFFALVADGAAGSKVYLSRVVEELKKDGALPADASIGSAEDLLDALGGAARRSASSFDAPPLGREDLARLGADLAADYAALWERTRTTAGAAAESLWKGLREARAGEAIPFLRLSGAMALSGAVAAGRATGALFCEKVVESYASSLRAVKEEGFISYFTREALPYAEAVAGAFAPDRKTFTERILDGWPFRRGT